MVITSSPCPKHRQARLYTLVNFQSAEPLKLGQFSTGSNRRCAGALACRISPARKAQARRLAALSAGKTAPEWRCNVALATARLLSRYLPGGRGEVQSVTLSATATVLGLAERSRVTP